MGVWVEWCAVRVTATVSMTAPISKKQKRVGISILQRKYGTPVYDSLCSAPWPFLFTILGLVKGGYRGVKKGRGGGVECKGWNLTIDFLVSVLRQEGTKRVRMGSFRLLGVLLIYSSLLSHVTPTGKLIYRK